MSTWSREVTWKIRSITSLLPQCLWPPNWQGDYKQWGAYFHKVIKPFDHVILQGHVTNQTRYISTTTRPMIIKFGKVVSYYGWLPCITSSNPRKKSGHMRSHDTLNIWYLCYHKACGEGSDLLREAPNLKVTWPFNHVVLWFWCFLIRFAGLERECLSRIRLLV